MSLRIDNSEWISSSLIIGNTGLGVLGQDIPSSGTNGESFLYNDLSLPADNAKEIRALILTYPSAGSLTVYEDGSFQFVGAPDGTYTFTYQLYVDGVLTGSVAEVTLNIGSAGTNLNASSSASATTAAGLSTAIRMGSDALSGSVTTATINTSVQLAAGVVSFSTTSSNLNTAVQMSAQAVVSATSSADLTSVVSGNTLNSSASTISVASGSLTSNILLRAIAVASVNGYANLSVGATPSTPTVVLSVKFKRPNYKITFK